MLNKSVGKKLNNYQPDYCVFDLETTGISTAADQVVEISAVKVRGGQVVGEFTTLVNPMMPIPAAASSVNGITDDMVVDAPIFKDALRDFLEFVGDDVLVGHNIHNFDMKFINRDANAYWGKMVGNDYIDTLQLSRMAIPGLAHYRLVDLAEHFHISSEGAHRALNDCMMNQQVFEEIGKALAANADAVKNAPVCPTCGSMLVFRKGRYGEFWGCSGFPTCRYTRNA